MRILFIASNPKGERPVNLSLQITALQQVFLAASNESVQFTVLPRLPFEDLQHYVRQIAPDILHITSHGEDDGLIFADRRRHSVKIEPEALLSYVDKNKPPRLIYLNACNSDRMAKSLVERVPLAIGTTAEIEIGAACDSACAFYDCLLRGASVAEAFEVGKQVVLGKQHNQCKTVLEWNKRLIADPTKEIFYQPPQLVARFVDPDEGDEDDLDYNDDRCEPDKGGLYYFRIGVIGCPPSSSQVVIFTDDSSFIKDKKERELENNLSEIVRAKPERGEIWLAGSLWNAYGDFRLFGTVVAGDSVFSVSSRLAQALLAFYEHVQRKGNLKGWKMEEVYKAVKNLRKYDGAKLPPK